MKFTFNKTKTGISKPKFTTGFTMIEILLVVGIAAGVFALSAPYSLNFYRTQMLEDTVSNVVNALQRARHNAVLQKNDSNFGVYMDNSTHAYTLFQGDSYTEKVTAQDEEFTVIEDMTFSGVTEVIFSKLTGATLNTGTTTITYGNLSRGILIGETGGLTTLEAGATQSAFTVIYSGNGSTGGSVPTDSNTYANGATVTVLGNTGSLVKTGYSFAGWNTSANGGGTDYVADATFAMGSANVTLYAKWTNALIAYWAFDGNAKDTVGTNDGTVYGATVSTGRGGLSNTGYLFNGVSDYIKKASATGFPTGTGAYAVSLWAYPQTGGSTGIIFLARPNGTGPYKALSVAYEPSTTSFGIHYDTCGVFANMTVSLDHWSHVVITKPAGSSSLLTKIYVNGVEQSLRGDSTNCSVNLLPEKIEIGAGWWNSDSAMPFKGKVDNVRVYNQELTSSEVTAIYNDEKPAYSVTYNGNGNTGGSAPVGDSYDSGATVTVLGNTGSLSKTGNAFSGWNTVANGTGIDYAAAATFVIGSASVTLYAQWIEVPTYTVTYNGNGNTGGSVPEDAGAYQEGATVTVLGNTGSLVNTGYSFDGWNTVANGSGTDYAPAATFAMGSANVTLYAQWGESLIAYYHLSDATDSSTYGNNGSVSGATLTTGVQGVANTAYDFVGGTSSGNSIDIVSSDSLNSPQTTRQISISFWMKPDSYPDITTFIGKGGNWPTLANGGFEILENNNYLCAMFGGDSFYAYSNYSLTSAIGNWTHVVVTADVSVAVKPKFYINGSLTGYYDPYGSAVNTNANLSLPNSLYIGRPDPNHHSNRGWFDGKMDEVRIYNRVLTQEEITAIYDAEKP